MFPNSAHVFSSTYIYAHTLYIEKICDSSNITLLIFCHVHYITMEEIKIEVDEVSAHGYRDVNP